MSTPGSPCSGPTSGGAQGTICDAKEQIWDSSMYSPHAMHVSDTQIDFGSVVLMDTVL